MPITQHAVLAIRHESKSLTMLWLAVKLRRTVALENPTLVVVTDRTDLDEQL